MKKFLICAMLLGMPGMIVHAEEVDLEDRVTSLEKQVKELFELQNMRSDSSEDTKETFHEKNIRIVNELPQNIEDGWEYAAGHNSYFSSVKIANMRYNNDFLFLDIKLIDCDFPGQKLSENVYRTFEIAQVSDEEIAIEDINLKLLPIQYNQIPDQLKGKHPVIKAMDETPENGSSVIVTVPFKLTESIEESSKIVLKFAENQIIQFDLEKASENL
ncbi:hypothetical protein ACQV2X_06710 [Facklamia sp. P12945]|uniref:hypothetical protein n=1 Tax=Facklamia sp. P12945 TaxID=3421950 RepID=UPI003D1866D0